MSFENLSLFDEPSEPTNLNTHDDLVEFINHGTFHSVRVNSGPITNVQVVQVESIQNIAVIKIEHTKKHHGYIPLNSVMNIEMTEDCLKFESDKDVFEFFMKQKGEQHV